MKKLMLLVVSLMIWNSNQAQKEFDITTMHFEEYLNICEAIIAHDDYNVKKFLKTGVDLNKRYSYRKKTFDGKMYIAKDSITPLQALSKYESFKGEAIKLFIENGLDASKANLLHYIIKTGYFDSRFGAFKCNLIRYAIFHNADVNKVDEYNGNTPLHELADKYDDDKSDICVARLLLDNGADINALNKEGKSAYQIAKSRDKSSNFIEVLKEAKKKSKDIGNNQVPKESDITMMPYKDYLNICEAIIANDQWSVVEFIKTYNFDNYNVYKHYPYRKISSDGSLYLCPDSITPTVALNKFPSFRLETIKRIVDLSVCRSNFDLPLSPEGGNFLHYIISLIEEEGENQLMYDIIYKAIDCKTKNCNADINKIDNQGNTPLHILAKIGPVAGYRGSALGILIKAGADVSIRNHEGKTPYEVAKMNKNEVKDFLETLKKAEKAK